jgi:hypothetical protein
MWLWGEYVYCIHIGIHFPLLLDSLNVLSALSMQSFLASIFHLLAIFSLRISSSLTTLSIIFLDDSSITSTFHWERVSRVNLRAWQTYVASGDGFNGVQDYCQYRQWQSLYMGMSVFLTVALLLNSRHHFGVLQRLGSINASMCSCDVKINRFWAVCIWGRAVRLRRNRVSWLGRYLEAWRGFAVLARGPVR